MSEDDPFPLNPDSIVRDGACWNTASVLKFKQATESL